MNVPMTYWVCNDKHHIVLDCYMPQSGTKCNVVRCEGVREQVSDEVPEHIAAMNTANSWLFKFSGEGDDSIHFDAIHAAALLEEFIVKYLKESEGL